MKIIITGAGGFLGRNLVKKLMRDHDLIALSSDSDKLSEFKSESRVQIMSNESFFAQAIDLSEYTLIHLAYIRSRESEVLEQNLAFTFKLMEQMKANGISRIVNISSQSVYHEARQRAALETDMPRATSLYAVGKFYVEQWIREFGLLHQIDFVNLRIASLVGPGFEQRITTRFIQMGIKNQEIRVDLNGRLFSYTHVQDMADGIIAAALNDSAKFWNKTYNLGADESYTLEEIGLKVQKELKRHGLAVKLERNQTTQVIADGSIDSSRFRRLTGWEPKYRLEDIIKEEVEIQIKK